MGEALLWGYGICGLLVAGFAMWLEASWGDEPNGLHSFGVGLIWPLPVAITFAFWMHDRFRADEQKGVGE